MLRRAAAEHAIDLQNTYLIGDTLTDIGAGRRVGATPLLVLTGLGQESYFEYIGDYTGDYSGGFKGHADGAAVHPERVFTDLYTATRWLLKNDS